MTPMSFARNVCIAFALTFSLSLGTAHAEGGWLDSIKSALGFADDTAEKAADNAEGAASTAGQAAENTVETATGAAENAATGAASMT